MAFSHIVLDNVGSGTSKVVNLRSASTILNCISGSATVTDISYGGNQLLTTIDPSTKYVLDYYPGADVEVAATAAGTTVVFGIHGDESL